MTMTKTTYDALTVEVFPSNEELGRAAAEQAAKIIADAVEAQGLANVMLATGNSQLQFLKSLRKHPKVPWIRVQLFHMDEYLGMTADHPASFRRFLNTHIVREVNPAAFYGISGEADDTEAECHRYERLLREYPIDLCCMGFGENGHIAFNDPPYADFSDDQWVKVVELDEVSRRQQVSEGHFASLEDVPKQAITATIPGLLAAKRIIAVVPEQRKAQAVRNALLGEISERCPASILRQVPTATLYLDGESASLLHR
jgi:glucosamine-6-phosphate deaminase